MSNDEQEFEARKQKIEAFKADLVAVFAKHKPELTESSNYDGEDNYIGSTYYFVFDGETWYSESVDEIINKAINANTNKQ